MKNYLFLLFSVMTIGCFSQNLDNSETIDLNDFVLVKGDTFKMGCDTCIEHEKPAHLVKVNDFYLGKFEVTNEQFCDFINKNGNQVENGKTWINIGGGGLGYYCKIIEVDGIFKVEKGFEKHPVIDITWFAARSGGKDNLYSWGSDSIVNGKGGGNVADETCKMDSTLKALETSFSEWDFWDEYEDGYVYTAPVGTYEPNKLGLFDMTGNVFEWCFDWYGESYYKRSEFDNPKGPESGERRIVRGGSWVNSPFKQRTIHRDVDPPLFTGIDVGFRILIPIK